MNALKYILPLYSLPVTINMVKGQAGISKENEDMDTTHSHLSTKYLNTTLSSSIPLLFFPMISLGDIFRFVSTAIAAFILIFSLWLFLGYLLKFYERLRGSKLTSKGVRNFILIPDKLFPKNKNPNSSSGIDAKEMEGLKSRILNLETKIGALGNIYAADKDDHQPSPKNHQASPSFDDKILGLENLMKNNGKDIAVLRQDFNRIVQGLGTKGNHSGVTNTSVSLTAIQQVKEEILLKFSQEKVGLLTKEEFSEWVKKLKINLNDLKEQELSDANVDLINSISIRNTEDYIKEQGFDELKQRVDAIEPSITRAQLKDWSEAIIEKFKKEHPSIDISPLKDDIAQLQMKLNRIGTGRIDEASIQSMIQSEIQRQLPRIQASSSGQRSYSGNESKVVQGVYYAPVPIGGSISEKSLAQQIQPNKSVLKIEIQSETEASFTLVDHSDVRRRAFNVINSYITPAFEIRMRDANGLNMNSNIRITKGRLRKSGGNWQIISKGIIEDR